MQNSSILIQNSLFSIKSLPGVCDLAPTWLAVQQRSIPLSAATVASRHKTARQTSCSHVWTSSSVICIENTIALRYTECLYVSRHLPSQPPSTAHCPPTLSDVVLTSTISCKATATVHCLCSVAQSGKSKGASVRRTCCTPCIPPAMRRFHQPSTPVASCWFPPW